MAVTTQKINTLGTDLKWVLAAAGIFWLGVMAGAGVAIVLLLGLLFVGVLAFPAGAILGIYFSIKFLKAHGVAQAAKISVWSGILSLSFILLASSSTPLGWGRIIQVLPIIIVGLSFIAGYWVFNKAQLSTAKSIVVFVIVLMLGYAVSGPLGKFARFEEKQDEASQLGVLSKNYQLYRPSYLPDNYKYFGYSVVNYQIANSEKYLDLIYYPNGDTHQAAFAIEESKLSKETPAQTCESANKLVTKGDWCVDIGRTVSGNAVYVKYEYINGKRYDNRMTEVFLQIGQTKISFNPPFDTNSNEQLKPTIWSESQVMQLVNSLQPVSAEDLKQH